MSAYRSAIRPSRRLGEIGRKAALAAPFLLMLGAAPASHAASLPEMGRWHGDTMGAGVTDLNLQGSLQAGGGTYEVGSFEQSYGSIGPFSSSWSGRWAVVDEVVDGRNEVEIRLQDAPNNVIDRYFVAPNDVLEPTPDLVHRPLTPEEIAEYSLNPVHES